MITEMSIHWKATIKNFTRPLPVLKKERRVIRAGNLAGVRENQELCVKTFFSFSLALLFTLMIQGCKQSTDLDPQDYFSGQ